MAVNGKNKAWGKASIVDAVTVAVFVIIVIAIGLDIVCQIGYLNIDTPSVLILAEKKLNNLVFVPNPRMDFAYNVIIRGSAVLLGNTTTVHYAVQYMFYMVSLLAVYFFVRKGCDHIGVAVLAASFLIWASPSAENLYTIGKKEIYLTFGMAASIISLYKLCFSDRENSKIATSIWGVLYTGGLLFCFTLKETGYVLLACFLLVILYCVIYNRTYMKVLGKCTLLFIAVLVLIRIYKSVYVVQSEYTSYQLSLSSMWNNFNNYLRYDFDIFILGIVGLGASAYMFFKDKKDIYCAYALILNLTGWGYLAGLLLWRWSWSYYIYPCAFFFALSLGTMGRIWKGISRWSKIVFAGVIFVVAGYAINYNYCVASAYKDVSRIYTESIQELNAVAGDQDRVMLANSNVYEEPAVQLRNILVEILQNNCSVYGVRQNIFQVDVTDEILNLYGYTREEYDDTVEEIDFQVGDYIVNYINDRNFDGLIRAINPMSSDGEIKERILNNGVEVQLLSSDMVDRRYWKIGESGFQNMNTGYEIYQVTNITYKLIGLFEDGWTGRELKIENYQLGDIKDIEVMDTASWIEGYEKNYVEIYSNDRPVGRFEAVRGSRLNLDDYLEGCQADEKVNIKLVLEKTFVPSEETDSNDNRELGINISIHE